MSTLVILLTVTFAKILVQTVDSVVFVQLELLNKMVYALVSSKTKE